ncbi:MAG: hypothetical protein MUF75_08425 [Bacteroidia bacterium]|nr:hypothetical protein [Bacteroidia bacterium]
MRPILSLLLLLSSLWMSSQLPPRPVPAKLYNNLSKNFPEFLNAQEAAQLEEKFS